MNTFQSLLIFVEDEDKVSQSFKDFTKVFLKAPYIHIQGHQTARLLEVLKVLPIDMHILILFHAGTKRESSNSKYSGELIVERLLNSGFKGLKNEDNRIYLSTLYKPDIKGKVLSFDDLLKELPKLPKLTPHDYLFGPAFPWQYTFEPSTKTNQFNESMIGKEILQKIVGECLLQVVNSTESIKENESLIEYTHINFFGARLFRSLPLRIEV